MAGTASAITRAAAPVDGPGDRTSRAGPLRPRGRRGLGITLNLASAVAYSTSGFWTRLIPLDPWTILFWRGLFAGLFIAGVIVCL
jgi:hypothetical protein